MSSVEDAGWHFARKFIAEEVGAEILSQLSHDVRMQVRRLIHDDGYRKALENEIVLLRKLTREAYISAITHVNSQDVPSRPGLAPEWRELTNPRLIGDRLFYNESKKIGKLRYDTGRPTANEINLSTAISLHGRRRRIPLQELCAFGQVTESLTEDVHYEDVEDLEYVNVEGTGLRGFVEWLGVVQPKVVKKPKHKIRKHIVGERPMKLGELVKDGGDQDAHSLIYIIGGERSFNLGTDGRPRGDEAEMLLSKDLGSEAFDAISKDPKLIRRIVARMIAQTFGIDEEAWLHILPPHHPAFGIAYGEWAERGRTEMYLHGPEAPEGFFEQYVREIS